MHCVIRHRFAVYKYDFSAFLVFVFIQNFPYFLQLILKYIGVTHSCSSIEKFVNVKVYF